MFSRKPSAICNLNITKISTLLYDVFRRLARNYLPKKKEEDEYQFTATKAFKLMLNEINDLAGQHEVKIIIQYLTINLTLDNVAGYSRKSEHCGGF